MCQLVNYSLLLHYSAILCLVHLSIAIALLHFVPLLVQLLHSLTQVEVVVSGLLALVVQAEQESLMQVVLVVELVVVQVLVVLEQELLAAEGQVRE